MRVTGIAYAALTVWALAGCVPGAGASASPSPLPSGAADQIGLGVDNGTELQLFLVVNSAVVEALAPHTADRSIPMSALPPLPWVVQVKTPSGRALVTMTAAPADLQGPAVAGDVQTGQQAGAELSCGPLYLWTGASEPIWPAPGSGAPGDCLP